MYVFLEASMYVYAADLPPDQEGTVLQYFVLCYEILTKYQDQVTTEAPT
jgi:hypothetical protein